MNKEALPKEMKQIISRLVCAGTGLITGLCIRSAVEAAWYRQMDQCSIDFALAVFTGIITVVWAISPEIGE